MRLIPVMTGLCLASLISACGGEDTGAKSAGAEEVVVVDPLSRIRAADGEDHGEIKAVRARGLHAMTPGQTLTIFADAIFADDATGDATEQATVELLSEGGETLTNLGVGDGWELVAGDKASRIQLKITLGEDKFTAEETVEVLKLVAPATGLMEDNVYKLQLLAPSADPEATEPVDVSAQAKWSWEVTKTSSVGYAPRGRVKAGSLYLDGNKGDRTVTVRAEYGDLNFEQEVQLGCIYPDNIGTPIDGMIYPAMEYSVVYGPGPTATANKTHFSFREAFCAKKNPKTIFTVVTASWCVYCKQYFGSILPTFLPKLAEGTVMIYYHADGVDGKPGGNVRSEVAAEELSERMATTAAGLRLGGEDIAAPFANWARNTPLVGGYPTIFGVRTQDMRVFVSTTATGKQVPLPQASRYPERDWYSGKSNPGSVPSCPAGTEELSEPNNSGQAAHRITEAGELKGGLCGADNLDVYHVDMKGQWRATLKWEASIGELDILDLVTPREPTDGAGVEVYVGNGPKYLGVTARQARRGAYTLQIEKL